MEPESNTKWNQSLAVPQKLKKIKVFDLSSVVKPLGGDEQERLSVAAFQRLLIADSKYTLKTCE